MDYKADNKNWQQLEQLEWEAEDEEWQKGVISPMRIEFALRRMHGFLRIDVDTVMDALFPDATRALAIEVVETMVDMAENSKVKAMSLNPQRIEWLKRWANSRPICQGSDVQEVEDEWFTKDVQEAIHNAINCGLIEKTNEGYDWKHSKVLLSYFCGRVFCGDYISEDGAFGSKPWYKKEGGKDFPAQQVAGLFTIKGKKAVNVDGSRQTRITKQGTVPIGYEKVENCLSGLF